MTRSGLRTQDAKIRKTQRTRIETTSRTRSSAPPSRCSACSGTGLPESAYAAALAIELAEREIGFARDVPVSASYKGRALGEAYPRRLRRRAGGDRARCRAVDALDDLHRAQAAGVLRLSGLKLGLLINFNVFPWSRTSPDREQV